MNIAPNLQYDSSMPECAELDVHRARVLGTHHAILQDTVIYLEVATAGLGGKIRWDKMGFFFDNKFVKYF